MILSLLAVVGFSFLLLSRHGAAFKGQEVIGGITITSPPPATATECATHDLFKRVPSCSFGACGTTCLSQGAFCCNPAGSLAVEPQWICDNGACITSVRGETGIVDCYDPDNPSGTTQSCIDNVPTTTCQSTDRCYTCSTDVPFCHWQTYIDTSSPVLSWFSCVSTRVTDETFYAATVTAHLLPTQTTSSNNPTLSVGEIVGIAVGGVVFLVACVGLVVYFCFKRRNLRDREQSGFEHWWRHPSRQISHEMSAQWEPAELDSYSTVVEAPNWSDYQQGAWKAAQPVAELPGAMAVVPPRRGVAENYI